MIEIHVMLGLDGSTWQTPRASVSWTEVNDRTSLADGVAISRGSADDGEVKAGTCSLVLVDTDRRFDPEYAAGPHYGFLMSGAPLWVYVTIDGIDYDRFYGHVAEFPQQATSKSADSQVRVPLDATDAFAMFAEQRTPRSVYAVEAMVDSPTAYWPLDEQDGSVMTDRSGNRLDGDYTHGTTALAGEIGPIPALVLDGEHVGHSTQPLPNPTSLTVEAYVDLTQMDTEALTVGNYFPFVELANGNIVHWVYLYITDLEPLSALLVYRARGTSFVGGNADLVFDARTPRHVAVRVTSSGSVHDYWVDGVQIPTATDIAPLMYGTSSGMRVGGSKANRKFRGALAEVALFSASLSPARIAEHAAAATAPLEGQTTGERIGWLLDQVGFPTADRDIATGYTQLGKATTRGAYTLDLIRRVEQTEQGRFFIGRDGTATFHARYHAQLVSTVPAATLSDDTNDVAYAAVELVRPRRLIRNKVTVTTDGFNPVVVSDQPSIGQHGEHEYTIDAPLLTSIVFQRALGEYVLSVYKHPLLRVYGVSVPVHLDVDGVGPEVLSLEIGDRVMFERTPLKMGDPVVTEQVIEGYSERFDQFSWWWTPNLSPTPPGVDGGGLFLLSDSELSGSDFLAY